MVRTKGEAGTGNVVEAVRHIRMVNEGVSLIKGMNNNVMIKVAETAADSYLRLRKDVMPNLFLRNIIYVFSFHRG